MQVVHGLLNFAGRVMFVTDGELGVLPASAEILGKRGFRAVGHIPQRRLQIRIQLICFAKLAQDIGDVPDSNLRTKAGAVRVWRRNRSASHAHTKCDFDDLLGAIASVLVSLACRPVFHFAISLSNCCDTTSKSAALSRLNQPRRAEEPEAEWMRKPDESICGAIQPCPTSSPQF
jgi:hypothetical protein